MGVAMDSSDSFEVDEVGMVFFGKPRAPGELQLYRSSNHLGTGSAFSPASFEVDVWGMLTFAEPRGPVPLQLY